MWIIEFGKKIKKISPKGLILFWTDFNFCFQKNSIICIFISDSNFISKLTIVTFIKFCANC